MKFCMLTSFFGKHSFGGDSAYVDRLSRALASRGHEVHVIYCRDAFELVRGTYPDREYRVPEGVYVHGLEAGLGPLSPLWTQQTGHPGPKWPMIREIVRRIEPDVVHFHNLSLIGGPGLLLRDFGPATRLMSAHEHWLVCPMHVLWRSDGRLCDRPKCHRCSLASGRPPQLWRHGRLMKRGLERLHRLIVPSRSAADEHRKRGVERPIDVLPYFLPDDWPFARRLDAGHAPADQRPYFACVGRLETIKGFQDAIGQMHLFPDMDLRIAGHGEFGEHLRRQAADLPNVIFEGVLEGDRLRRLIRGARALIVPSLVPETFGYVVLEAFAQGRPVVGRHLGALPDLLNSTGGGITFESSGSLADAMRRLAEDETLANSLGRAGAESIPHRFDEETHLKQYLAWAARTEIEPGESSNSNDEPAGTTLATRAA
ncbi:glycosyltransferase [bacterium]|nr:glycosyltransferase [bacterium]